MAMAQKPPTLPSGALKSGNKRKHDQSGSKPDNSKRVKFDNRAKQRDARALSTQTSSTLLKNGELDVGKFVQAREYEIRALEEGMSRSKKALNQRAFQQVPKDLRRRTASHNVKRVPKRLQPRAKREMIEDKTPTVVAKKRKPSRRMRLRNETAKKLRAFGSKSKAAKSEDDDKVIVKQVQEVTKPPTLEKDCVVKTRAARIKKASPPVPKAKFRKRQINKTWLPTHLFHAKRARLTAPREPLWRFAIPLTPTAKCYRPTHRAANERGVVAWDMSYVSTIRLEGQQRSIEGILKALGVENSLWQTRGEKWRHGSRVWEGFAFEREAPHAPIAPTTVVWCAEPRDESESISPITDLPKRKRSLFVRVHPSAFYQIWQEIVRLAKVAKPQVSVEDLRFEIGSIELQGPGAAEALQSALTPSVVEGESEHSTDSVENSWRKLAGLRGQAVLPSDTLFSFTIRDPRLHHPPRTIDLPMSSNEQDELINLIATWPFDSQQRPSPLFASRARLTASAALPSQKAINRRKALAVPGQYPEPSPKDSRIPVLCYCQTMCNKQSVWTVLLPWKCVQPVWYGIMYYPLSTGGQPRFGGLDEQRQLCFERGQPWFPGDLPGTQAGWQWELQERAKRQDDWKRRPKSKRVNWDAVQLGNGRKGEVGIGWACDWERLLNGPPIEAASSSAQEPPSEKPFDHGGVNAEVAPSLNGVTATDSPILAATKPSPLTHIIATQAYSLLHSASTLRPPEGTLITIRLKLLTRGVPQTCARIYRLPATTSASARNRWLDLHPKNQARDKSKGPKNTLPSHPKDAPRHVVRQLLARSLLEPPRPGQNGYPPCPVEEDLIGFVTTGNFNLAEGQGSGVGSIMLARVVDEVRRDDVVGRLCIVRNAGNDVGRLARWETA